MASETKTAVVSTVKHIDSKTGGQFGPQEIYEVTFDNGDKARYYGKTNPQNKFVEGKSVEYILESKENGNYTNFFCKPVPTANAFNGGGGKPENTKAQNAREALRCATMLVSSGIIQLDKLDASREKFMDWLTKKSE